MQLRDYQKEIIDFIMDHPRCSLFVPMGLGKTVSVLTALDDLSLVEEIFPILVVAPHRVARTTWPVEVNKWAHLRHLTVSVIIGTPAERKAALNAKADIYTINYENLPWLDQTLNGKWRFPTVVADEQSKLKGFRLRQGTKRSRALARYAHSQTKRYIGLTGTPSPNGLIDLWGQQWFVDNGKALGTSYQGFADRFFRSERVGADPHAVKLVPLPFTQSEVEERLKPTTMSLDPHDWFDLKEPIVNNIFVDLPLKARSIYNEMEKEMFVELQRGSVEAFNAAARSLKCLQIANGALYLDEAGKHYDVVHDSKIEALEEIVEEAAGMPVLVAYHFKSDLDRLLKAFPKGRHLDKDPQTIQDWNDGKIPLLFAHPASAGHGLNLQDGGNILVFFSHWWNLEEYQQIVERIGPTRQAQAGYDRPVFIHNIIATDTVDELVMARRDSKKSVQDLLLEAMERKLTQ